MTAQAIDCRPRYCIGEEIGSAVSHGVGALLGIAGTVLMIIKGAGSAWSIVACAIYGFTIILLFTMSSLYHAITNVRAKSVLRIMDHSTIFLLIAGTYTPFTLISLRGLLGWIIFGVVWATAIGGIVLNAISIERFKTLSMIGYIVSGWCILIALIPLYRVIHGQGIQLLVYGGILYTTGIVFYRQKQKKFTHFVWHLFVLGGAVLHYFCIYLYVL